MLGCELIAPIFRVRIRICRDWEPSPLPDVRWRILPGVVESSPIDYT